MPGNNSARLVLIRHAEINCSCDGSPLLCGSHDAELTEAGWRQVERLRRRLVREPAASAVYVSPLRRAVDTAQAIPDCPGRPKRFMESLAEIHCGSFEGKSVEQIRREFPDLWARNEAQDDEDFGWPEGETYKRFRHRVLRGVKAVAAQHPCSRVLIVTHAGVVSQILGYLHGRSAARWEEFRPGNTAVTEVLWSGDSGELVRFDDRTHLQD